MKGFRFHCIRYVECKLRVRGLGLVKLLGLVLDRGRFTVKPRDK